MLAIFGMVTQANAAPSPLPRPTVPSATAGTDSSAPMFSGNGRFLFFQSTANDLVPEDSSSLSLDLFRYEPPSDTLIRVSAEPVAGGKAADWISPATSADGDLVVFASLSTAIVPGKTNARVMDIFWKRISTGDMGLVSVSSNGVSGGNGDSREPVISADGRYVLFESDATDLAPLDNVTGPAGSVRSVVYVRDLQAAGVVPVSAPSDGADVSSSGHAPSLSPDGRVAAFFTKSLTPASTATRLVVRNHLTGEILWTYTMDRYTGSNCRGPQFSPNGKRVAFFSRETTARMRLAVHDLETGSDYSLTNDFLLCAPIVWSASNDRIYVETFFQIGAWDLETGALDLHNLRNPVSQASGASWSGLAVSPDSSFLMYRDTLVLNGGNASRRVPSLYLRQWPQGPSTLITLDTLGAPAVQDELGTPVLSSDGRWVAFEASDSTLVEGDLNRSKDIFLHELQSRTTRVISRHRLSAPASTGSGTLIGRTSVAAANRRLAFSAGDGNYGNGDTNRSLDVFLQGIGTDLYEKVTLDQPGFQKAYQRYLNPQLSASGDVVVFLAYPVNSTDGSGFPLPTELQTFNVLSGDRKTLMPAGNDLGLNGVLGTPLFHLSANGQRVAFEAHIPEFESTTQILVRDLGSSTNLLVSDTPARRRGNGSSTQPWVTPDGNRVIFLSTSSDLLSQPVLPVLRRLYERNLESGTTRLLSTNTVLFPVDAPVISPDGRYAAFRMGEAPRTSLDALARVVDLVGSSGTRTYPGVRQVYGFDQQSRYAVGLMTNASEFSSEGTLCRLDLTTGETLPFSAGRGFGFWLSVAPDSPPVISADGRYIVFESPDDSLVVGDKNRVSDIFLRDTVEGTTLLVSASWTGTGSGNGISSQPTLSADGGAVVFRSRASDLTDADFNAKGDLFILTFTRPDTDADGLPDDWEMTYFGSLSRDGSGDQDSDGLSDAEEYRAGTDPTGSSSVLRVLTLQSAGGARTEILWATVAGKHYRVEYKDSVTGTVWISGIDDFAATSETGRWTDSSPAAGGQRYYRVVVLE